jgi:NAD(P)-dependent dehydrogenase (short-subunit alcohol dehydrogenase family)
VVADKDIEAAESVAVGAQKVGGKETAIAVAIDIRDRESIRQALRETVAAYGGLDIIVNTAAIFPSSPDGQISDAQWALTLDINVTANHRLLEEASEILLEQDLTASVVLVSSANAVVPKRGS